MKQTFSIECSANDRLNVIGSKSVMESNGWTFEFTNDGGLNCGSEAKWHGWSANSVVGTLSAVLRGEGTVTLDFGNCWDAGNVNVYLDSTLMARAPVGTKSLIKSFPFTSGSVLKIKDEDGNAVVMVNSIKIECKGMF